MLSQKTVSLPIEQAYAELKTVLIRNKCKITQEKPFGSLTVKQGSLNGILPKSAKKIVTFQLTSESSQTKIKSSTKIASDWTYMTLVGNVVAAVLAGIFLWMALDIQNYLKTAKAGFWGWLAQVYGYPDRSATTSLVNLTLGLAVFLLVAIVVEIVIVVYVYPRKEEFAAKMLLDLQSPN